jgi:hypothetical protein
MVQNALSSYIASKLTTKSQGKNENEFVNVTLERLLRAGLVEEAVDILCSAGRIEFTGTEYERRDDSILVVDDLRRVDTGLKLYDDRSELPQNSFGLPCSGRYVALSEGDKVVFSETDYRNLPPLVRQGALATIEQILSHRIAALRTDSGHKQTIDLGDWDHLRAAQTLTIAEARRALDSPMVIEVTRPTTAWAALLLAARAKVGRCLIRPTVASNGATLKMILRRYAATVISPLLERRVDLTAEAVLILDDILAWALPGGEHLVPRELPDVELDSILSDLIREDPLALEGFRYLYSAIGPGAPDRQNAITHLSRLVVKRSPLAAVVDAIVSSNRPRPKSDALEALDDSIGAVSIGAGFTHAEISNFISDLRTMSVRSTKWRLTSGSPSIKSEDDRRSPQGWVDVDPASPPDSDAVQPQFPI